MTEQYANDSRRVIEDGYVRSPGVPLTVGRMHPGEQCAALGKAYNPALGPASGWTAHRMTDISTHPGLVQPGQVLVTKGYDDAAKHGEAGGLKQSKADNEHIMRTHTIGVVTAPDRQGNFWAIEQFQGQAARLKEYNVGYSDSPHGQSGNTFQILADEHGGHISRSPQMVADAQRLAQRDGNTAVVNSTTQTLHEMGNPHTVSNDALGQHESISRHQSPAPNQMHTTNEHHGLEQGAHGDAVKKVQGELVELGYLGPKNETGHFGPLTHEAVKQFQHDHGLPEIGSVGPRTTKALEAAAKEHEQKLSHGTDRPLVANASESAVPGKVRDAGASTPLNDPKNPDHAMYQQALDGVHKLDAAIGRTPDQHSANLAAGLVVEAKAAGLTRIDRVEMSPDGAKTFAAQNTSPLKTVADVPTLQAMNTPIQQSSTAAQAVQPTQTASPIQAHTASQPQAAQPQTIRV